MALVVYSFQNNKIEETLIQANGDLPKNAIWFDLLNPTQDEETSIETHLKMQIPTREEMHEIELSNRFYNENDTTYCTLSVPTRMDSSEPEMHAITCMMRTNILVTLRYSQPYGFNIYADRLKSNQVHAYSGASLFFGLCEAIINRLADVLENSSHTLDKINKTLFRPSNQNKKLPIKQTPDFEELLLEIGLQGDLLSKIRESLLSLTRALSFSCNQDMSMLKNQSSEHAQTLIKDISALNDHANFLANKASFLLDGTLGQVSIQQNNIIKIFSVAAVIFLPPTLVASIYGMNFNNMPELSWTWGYPFAIILMVFSAFIPFLYFKKKKWL